MLASIRSFNCSFLSHGISIVCVAIAFSYIFFEVLDLDGPVQMTAIVSEVETDVIRSQPVHWANPRIEVSFFLLAKPIEWVHRFSTEKSLTPTFHLLHRCGYRTALPRSSIPDDFLVSV